MYPSTSSSLVLIHSSFHSTTCIFIHLHFQSSTHTLIYSIIQLDFHSSIHQTIIHLYFHSTIYSFFRSFSYPSDNAFIFRDHRRKPHEHEKVQRFIHHPIHPSVHSFFHPCVHNSLFPPSIYLQRTQEPSWTRGEHVKCFTHSFLCHFMHK